MTNPLWSVQKIGANVFRVVVPFSESKSWEHWHLLSFDRHIDNPDSDLSLQTKHLKEAIDRSASISDGGDLYCAMQGKYDPRGSKSKLRPEHRVDNYFDSIVDSTVDFLSPYAKNIVCIGSGNHEESVKNRHEIDLIERTVTLLNHKNGTQVHNGHFSGWIIFSFMDGYLPSGSRRYRYSTVLHYDHGYGGGGPVTTDLIQMHRRAAYIPDADILCSGHTHDYAVRPIGRIRLTPMGNISHDIQLHIKVPSYKNEYKEGLGGWYVGTGKAPKPIGAVWLRFSYCFQNKKIIFDASSAS